MSAQKALQVSKGEMRELLGGFLDRLVPCVEGDARGIASPLVQPTFAFLHKIGVYEEGAVNDGVRGL